MTPVPTSTLGTVPAVGSVGTADRPPFRWGPSRFLDTTPPRPARRQDGARLIIHRVDIPDRLIELQQAADAEHAKLSGLDGEERAAQWKRWFAAAEASQAAVIEHAAISP